MAVLKQVVPLEKPRSTKKQEIDFKFLLFLMSFGKYYGAIPTLEGHKNEYQPKIRRFIILALLLMFVVQECLSLQTPDSILGLLQIIWQLTDVCFLYSSVYQSNFSASGNWALLLTHLGAMEELLGPMGFRPQDNLLAISTQACSIWAVSLVLIAWNVFFLIQDWTGPPDFTSYSWLIVNVYVTNFITLIFILTKILRQRYRHINWKIGKQLRKNDLDGAFLTDFENTVRLLKTMREVVKQMNIIFGWQFFFFVNIMIIRVVHSCFVAVFFLNPSNPGKQVETVIYAAALILIVLPCDYLEESGRIIVKTCYSMHLRTIDERTRYRLLDLGRYADDWKPTLSAAGFFDIQKECLNSVFETFVTYLVVSIQFKMSLDSPEN